ncbi:MAG TPA: hypothetical protein VMV24_00850 [Candidatus Dormibacteraeota bacterium]|nr:hypothetical protein [Candidatus Dormibacteraeota bacterium]
MISKIKSILIGFVLIASMGIPLAVPAIANASSITSNLCGGANGTLGSTSSCASKNGTATTSVNKTISLVLNLFSAVVGIIVVIMIIIGGVKYITSGGSSEKTSSAKDTILFAIVGLIVVALAQIIVRFVIHKATKL